MLRQGRFFADACYYYGQDVPGSAYFFSPAGNLDERKKMLPVLPKGYDYDVCDHTTFATMFVEDGFVGLPSGMRYKYLVLPDHARYTPDALEKVAELVKAGATVIGRKPSRCPSLADFENADAQIQKMAADLWPKGKGERRVGKGACDRRQIVRSRFWPEDKLGRRLSAPATDNVCYIHRKLKEGDVLLCRLSGRPGERPFAQLPRHRHGSGNLESGHRRKDGVVANYTDDGIAHDASNQNGPVRLALCRLPPGRSAKALSPS